MDKLMRLSDVLALLPETDAVGPKPSALRRQIEDLPPVDAVEVVRCKDCMHWEKGNCYRLELSRPDDYCSYGERLDNIK